jgi:cysteine sulfinate desulfinase/cysteine desulfurase-like protein
MKHLFSALFLSMLMAGTAAAQPAAPAASAHGGYGAAGCGLGSILFGSTPGFMQVFAATTNGLFGSQTFGITSGTSNCASTGGGGVAAKAFIETNREAFAKDVSRGSGETIDNLATLTGCADSKAVARNLQQNFKQIFPSAKVSNTEVSTATLESLKADKQLACSQLI